MINDKEIVYAKPGESLDSFERVFYEYKDAHKSAIFVFCGIHLDTDSDLTFMQQFGNGMREREEKYRSGEALRKQQDRKDILAVMDQFIHQAESTNEVVPIADIMKFLGDIGLKAGTIVKDLDSEKCQRIIAILAKNGYFPFSDDEAYRSGKEVVMSDETWIRAFQYNIVCKNSNMLPDDYSSEQLATYAISNALTQLSSNYILGANYGFSWGYEKKVQEEEAQLNENIHK